MKHSPINILELTTDSSLTDFNFSQYFSHLRPGSEDPNWSKIYEGTKPSFFTEAKRLRGFSSSALSLDLKKKRSHVIISFDNFNYLDKQDVIHKNLTEVINYLDIISKDNKTINRDLKILIFQKPIPKVGTNPLESSLKAGLQEYVKTLNRVDRYIKCKYVDSLPELLKLILLE